MLSKNLAEKVEKTLMADPSTRDNDMRLIAKIHFQEIGYRKDLPVVEYFKLMSDNKISNPQDIGRTRRKLQKLHPELRGSKYKERQEAQRKAIESIEEIGRHSTPQRNLF